MAYCPNCKYLGIECRVDPKDYTRECECFELRLGEYTAANRLAELVFELLENDIAEDDDFEGWE